MPFNKSLNSSYISLNTTVISTNNNNKSVNQHGCNRSMLLFNKPESFQITNNKSSTNNSSKNIPHLNLLKLKMLNKDLSPGNTNDFEHILNEDLKQLNLKLNT